MSTIRTMSRDIPVNLIDPDPAQARRNFDAVALGELAQSIDANGLAVPLLVRPGADGRFILVHGERRLRAAQSLGWETIPAAVGDLTPEAARWLALVENIQRADLTPTEEAHAFEAILATGSTQTELGRRIGKSQSYISTKLRFLKLPVEAQAALDAGALAEGHAKQLLRVPSVEQQTALTEAAVAASWTVQRLKEEVDVCLSAIFDEPTQRIRMAFFALHGQISAYIAKQADPPDPVLVDFELGVRECLDLLAGAAAAEEPGRGRFNPVQPG